MIEWSDNCAERIVYVVEGNRTSGKVNKKIDTERT